MRKKVLLIGGITAATLLTGGWALAQATGPGGFGPPFMRGMGHGGMGPGMMGGAPAAIFADPAQIETLKKEIGITVAQEPAWTKYTKTLQGRGDRDEDCARRHQS